MAADIVDIEDRREDVFRMEPMLVGDRQRGPLNDLALDLAQIAAGFIASLAKLVHR